MIKIDFVEVLKTFCQLLLVLSLFASAYAAYCVFSSPTDTVRSRAALERANPSPAVIRALSR